jgi:hypothetical protein
MMWTTGHSAKTLHDRYYGAQDKWHDENSHSIKQWSTNEEDWEDFSQCTQKVSVDREGKTTTMCIEAGVEKKDKKWFEIYITTDEEHYLTVSELLESIHISIGGGIIENISNVETYVRFHQRPYQLSGPVLRIPILLNSSDSVVPFLEYNDIVVKCVWKTVPPLNLDCKLRARRSKLPVVTDDKGCLQFHTLECSTRCSENASSECAEYPLNFHGPTYLLYITGPLDYSDRISLVLDGTVVFTSQVIELFNEGYDLPMINFSPETTVNFSKIDTAMVRIEGKNVQRENNAIYAICQCYARFSSGMLGMMFSK